MITVWEYNDKSNILMTEKNWLNKIVIDREMFSVMNVVHVQKLSQPVSNSSSAAAELVKPPLNPLLAPNPLSPLSISSSVATAITSLEFVLLHLIYR